MQNAVQRSVLSHSETLKQHFVFEVVKTDVFAVATADYIVTAWA
jgi:hypothetical protein